MKTTTPLLLSLLAITMGVAICSCRKVPVCTVTGLTVVSDTAIAPHLRWTGGTAPYIVEYRPLGTQWWDSAICRTDTVELLWLAGHTDYEWQVKAACADHFSTRDTFRTSGCQPSYEGPYCRTPIRAKYLGSYVGDYSCPGSPALTTTVMVGSSAADILGLIISDGSTTYTGTLSDSTITFTGQSQNGGTVQGTGLFTTNGSGYTLNLAIVTSINSITSTCTYTGSKQ
ncbi:MAG: hypothetical protein JST76_12530 [Bacteroidetes bacterium]|nr:hypothetical protein [Bacteroidota bacterium]